MIPATRFRNRPIGPAVKRICPGKWASRPNADGFAFYGFQHLLKELFEAILVFYVVFDGLAGVVRHPEGHLVRRQILINTLLLIAGTLAPTFAQMAGRVYFAGAVVLGLGLLYFGMQVCREYTLERARRLLLASVIYMPLLFALLVFDNLRFSF